MFFLSTFLNQVSTILRDSLEAVGAKAMVVGHTPQLSGVNWYIPKHILNTRFYIKKKGLINENILLVNMVVAYGELMWECPVVFLTLDQRYL